MKPTEQKFEPEAYFEFMKMEAEYRDATLASIAISLKRIADLLCSNGSTSVQRQNIPKLKLTSGD